MKLLIRSIVALLAVCPAALAAGISSPAASLANPASAGGASDPSLAVSHSHTGGGHFLRAEVRDGIGPAFVLFACRMVAGQPDRPNAIGLGMGALDADGDGTLVLPAPDFRLMPQDTEYLFIARFATGDHLEQSMGANPPCEEIDWDFHPVLPMPLLAGTIVDDEWQAIGLAISATNNVPSHPDMVIVFDSAAPTGEDTDLVTPGYGPGNDTALGSLLIIAEDAIDMDGDGLIDDPDDEGAGGVMRYEFEEQVRLTAITLVDIDDAGATELRFFDGMDLIETIGVPNLGDNSVQTVLFDVSPVTRLEVALGGSGGIAGLCASLCPTRLDFDFFTTGVPMPDAVAGRELTTVVPLGMTFAAVNNHPAHPDMAILFDSSAPTGGDTDLVTPGYGIGNDDPGAATRRMVLIVAENDVDLDGDGLVDEPDDEALGGVLSADFVEDVVFLSASVLDVDEGESSRFELYDASNVLIGVLPLAQLGDNSLQSVGARGGIPNVRRIELHLDGSGAWVDLMYCPQLLPSP